MHIRDKELLVCIENYLKNMDLYFYSENVPAGSSLVEEVNNREETKKLVIADKNMKTSVHCSESKNTALLQIKSKFDIENKIIPFFSKYPLVGIKPLDFEDFKKASELVKNQEHLKIEGLRKITEIAEGMNLGRKL